MGAPLSTGEQTLTVTGKSYSFPPLHPLKDRSPLPPFIDNRIGKTITVPIEHNSIPATAFKKLSELKPDQAAGERDEDDVEGALHFSFIFLRSMRTHNELLRV
jgi:hypothetical protein